MINHHDLLLAHLPADSLGIVADAGHQDVGELPVLLKVSGCHGGEVDTSSLPPSLTWTTTAFLPA